MSAQTPDITLYPGVTAAYGVTAGQDGAIWFTEQSPGKIGRISLSGAIAELALSNAQAWPAIITTGPDGALWFTEMAANKIGRITAGGIITEYSIPTANAAPQGITTGPDGALWFAESATGISKIGRITIAGAISEFELPRVDIMPIAITAGPDGALWFTEMASKIGRITTAGDFTEFNLPAPDRRPAGITAGPDGALWFTEAGADRIGRITTAGIVTEYAVPTIGARPYSITTGPDGALWFTESGANRIGRITTSGSVTEYPIGGGEGPYGIAVGPDGALWFGAGSRIGRAQLAKTRTGVLSHIAAGGSWTTLITLINTNSVAMPATIKLYGDDGSATTLPLAVTQGGERQQLTASSVEATINPNATLLISIGEQLATLNVGWAEVLSTGALSGFAIFRDTPPNRADSEGTVHLQTQFPSTMVLPFDNSGGFVMGVAIVNLSSAPATVTGMIWDESGNQLGSATISVAGNGHASFVLPTQIPLTGGRRGIVRFQSSWTDGLAGLGLRFSPTHTFTSVPTMQ